MSDTRPTSEVTTAGAGPSSAAAPSLAPTHAYQPLQAPMAPMAPGSSGPVGKIRGTGVVLLLSVITFGIYNLYWFYKIHTEMKQHSGDGLGGGLALVLALFVGIAMPYLTASEVGGLYARAGQQRPVSGATGLWYFPGILILVGPIIWFVKTNGALNSYWRSVGVV